MSKQSKVDEFLAMLFGRIAEGIVKAPLVVIGVLFVATLGMASFIPNIVINNDGRIYFIEGDPMLEAQQRFERTFGSEQFVMYMVESDELFTPKGYAVVDGLKKKLEKVEFKGQPAFTGILTPFHAPALQPNTGSLDVSPVVASDNPTQADLDKAKALITTHPVYANSLVDTKGEIGAIVATMRALPNDEDYSQFIADAVKEIYDTQEGLQDFAPRLVGAPVFGSEMNLATAREAVIFGTLSVLVCIIALFLMFRRFRQVAAAIGVVVFSATWTVGLMAALGVEMSLVHTLLPPAIIVTGLGSGIHVINEYRLLSPLMDRHAAVVNAARSMGGPCALTAITTGIGFSAMLTAPVAPMRTLGVFIAVGVVLSFALALLFVPAVLALGGDAPKVDAGTISEKSDALFTRLAEVVVARAPVVALTFLVLAVALISGIPQLEVDTNFLHALRDTHPFRQTVEYVDDRIGGSSSVELVIDTGQPRGVYDPDLIKGIDKLQTWAEQNETDVVWVTLSVADLYRELNMAVSGARVLPETRKQAAELMFLYEAGGGITNNMMDHEGRRLRVSARTRTMSSTRSRALEAALAEKANELLKDVDVSIALKAQDAAAQKAPAPDTAPEAAPEPEPQPVGADGPVDENDDVLIIEDEEEVAAPDAKAEASDDGDDLVILDEDEPVKAPAQGKPGQKEAGTPPAGGYDVPTFVGAPRVEVAGSAPLFSRLNDYVIQSQLKSFSLAAIIIGFIMMFMLRSARLGLAIMIPNVLPIFSTYGLMGWLGIPMDFMTAVIAVAAIGVAVDGTIHIGTRYRRARADGLDSGGAAKEVMTSVGRALVVTSLALSAGFCVLAPSVLATLATFGVMMAFCLFLALLYDLLMTPAVLAWLSPDGR